jgi:general L-amino acid transport system permease protein
MSDTKIATRAPGSASWRAQLRPETLLPQALILVGFALFVYAIAGNVRENLAALGLRFGFDFLSHTAGFRIGESLIPYTPSDSILRALGVGLVNTLRVAIAGAIIATVLGTLLGVLRLTTNPVVVALTRAYIEIVRNTPLLLQLVLWQVVMLKLPPVRQALNPLPGIYLSQRGLKIPSFEFGDEAAAIGLALVAAIVLCVVNLLRRKYLSSDATRPIWHQNISLLIAMPIAAALYVGGTPTLSVPELRGFNFVGGSTLSPEFTALLIGLVVYATAFIAEIVRSGIQTVPAGQWEAARALGLRPGRIVRLIVLPQALRAIIPPLTNQYLNLTKNSSLAVVVGYPELASVSNTIINQTGHAIETIAIFMGVYLILSLTTSVGMNIYNARIALKTR